ncbi:MAG: hypothetical protein AAF911_01320 [Planctomycetota bacterium]
MRIRQGLMWVGLWIIGTVVMAEAPGLPEAEVLAGWGATEWADAAELQAAEIRGEVDREYIHADVLMALCQAPGQQQRVARLADEAVERLSNRRGDPLEVDNQLPLVVYAYARIGDNAKARETLELIASDSEKVWGLFQMGWGTGERGDVEGTLGVIADIELALKTLEDEWDRGYYESEVPLLLWLIGEKEAAVTRVESIEFEDSVADAWLSLGHLAMDFGDEVMAQMCLDNAQQVMAGMADGGEWQVGTAASLTARLGEPAEAGAMMIRLSDPWDMINTGGEIGRAFARVGNDESAERMLRQTLKLAASVRYEPGFFEKTDIAYLWADAAVAAQQSGRLDLVIEAWDEAKTPLNRGVIAAAIAVEISWTDWLEQRQP